MVRLYGGWMRDGAATSLASKVAGSVRSDALFPMARRHGADRIYGSVELALDLLARPGFVLDQTLRSRPGLQRVKYHPELDRNLCSSAEQCPARTIKRYANNQRRSCSVDSCGAVGWSMFSSQEQKMVDSMLVCDLLFAASRNERFPSISIVSTDTDFVPGLLQASLIGTSTLAIVHPQTAPASSEWKSLEREGVHFSEVSVA